MSGIFHFFSTWFGYVGSCVFSPDATCRPFLAFVALGAAASVGLVLLVVAYRRAHDGEMSELAAQRARSRGHQIHERVRRAVPAAIRTNPPLRSGVAAVV